MNFQESEMEIEDEVDLLMSTDILAAQISTKSISFVRAQSGWIFREDKKVLISIYYSVLFRERSINSIFTFDKYFYKLPPFFS